MSSGNVGNDVLFPEPGAPTEPAIVKIEPLADEEDILITPYDHEDDGEAYVDQEEEEYEPEFVPMADPVKREPAVATKTGRGKRRRRGKVFQCKHGCGYTYTKKNDSQDRSARDAYDYHETQGCQLLPRLLCPLGCNRKGKLVSFGGIKALRNHYTSKGHQDEMRKAGVTEMEKLSAADGPPPSVPILEVNKKERRRYIAKMAKLNARMNGDADDEDDAPDGVDGEHGHKRSSKEKKRKKRQAKRERKAKRAKARMKSKMENRIHKRIKKAEPEQEVKREPAPEEPAPAAERPAGSLAFQEIFEHMYKFSAELEAPGEAEVLTATQVVGEPPSIVEPPSALLEDSAVLAEAPAAEEVAGAQAPLQ